MIKSYASVTFLPNQIGDIPSYTFENFRKSTFHFFLALLFFAAWLPFQAIAVPSTLGEKSSISIEAEIKGKITVNGSEGIPGNPLPPSSTNVSTYLESTATLTATSTGTIKWYDAVEGKNVTERGIVYNTTGTPTTSDTKVQIGSGEGSFSDEITGLSAETTYYVRAYAINSEGTSYGGVESFTTPSLYAGGSGTEGDPFQISNWSHLHNVRENLSAYFILNNNLDETSSGYNTYASASANGNEGWIPVMEFAGALDGKGYVIKGLIIIRTSGVWTAGLFGSVQSGGIVRNVGVIDATIISAGNVGILAGSVYGGQFENVYSSGSVSGIAGYVRVGGLIGVVNSGTVLKSFSKAAVSASTPTGNTIVGGLVGSGSGSISNSYSTGSVSGSAFSNNYVIAGGLVGYLGSDIDNSYSTGEVNGTVDSGSLIQGGLVGMIDDENPLLVITASFWNTETSKIAVSPGGTGKTIAQMKTLATFSGWDFTNTWSINPTGYFSYPYLRGLVYDEPGATLEVNPIPGLELLALSASDVTTCSGSSVTLTATGTGTIKWYDAATGGNLLFEGVTYVTPSLSSDTTYYLEDDTFSGTRTPVTVTLLLGSICGSVIDNVLTLKLPAGGTTISDLHASVKGNMLTLTVANTQNSLVLASDAIGISTDGTSSITVDLGEFLTFSGLSVEGDSGTDLVTIGEGGLDFSGLAGEVDQLIKLNLGSATDNLTISNPIKTKGAGDIYIQSGLGFDIGAALVTQDTLTIHSAGAVTQSAAVSAATLMLGKTGNTGSYTLSNEGNNSGDLRAVATGSITYTDVDGIIVRNATTAGDVVISAGGNISVENTGIQMTSGSGSVELTNSSGTITIKGYGIRTNGNVTVTSVGAISTGSYSINNTSGTGFISLTSTGGGISSSGYGLQSKGAITLSAAGAISFSGTETTNRLGSGDISLITTSGNINPGSGGMSSSGNMILTAPGKITISSSGISNSTGTGYITVTSSDNEVSIDGQGVSSKGDITIQSKGKIASGGSSIRNSGGTGKITLISSAAGITSRGSGIKSNGEIRILAAGDISLNDGSTQNNNGSGNITIKTTSGSIDPGVGGVYSKGKITLSGTTNINIRGAGLSNTSGTDSVKVSTSAGQILISNGGIESSGVIELNSFGLISVSLGGVKNSTGTAKNILVKSSANQINLTDAGLQSGGNVYVEAEKAVNISRGGIQNFTGTGEITIKSATSQVTVTNCLDCSDANFGLKSLGEITIEADSINLTGPVNSGTSAVYLKPVTAETVIDLGGLEASDTLGISATELAWISAGEIVIGDAANTKEILVRTALTGAESQNLSFLTKSTTGILNLDGSVAINTANTSGISIYQTSVISSTSANKLTVSEFANLGSETKLNLSSVIAGLVAGDKFLLIDNQGCDLVSGTFKDLAEGEILETQDAGSNPISFQISYAGGDGNDVELEVYSPVPKVTTSDEGTVSFTSAVLGGEVTSDEGSAVTEQGIVWATSTNPTTSDNKVAITSANTTFSQSITGLPAATTVYVRAYAINSIGTGYGNEISFKTLASTDATLSGLAVNTGTLTPTFSSATTSYTIYVNNDQDRFDVTPTVTESGATIKVDDKSVSSGSASDTIWLNVGKNTITVRVTAQDGTSTKTYTLTVYRKNSLTVTVENQSKILGEADPKFKVNYTGFAGDDDETVLGGSLVFERETGETVGAYSVTASGLSSDSYEIEYVTGSLTILGPPTFISKPTIFEIGYGENYLYPVNVSVEGDLPTSISAPVLPSWLDFSGSGQTNASLFATFAETDSILGVAGDKAGNIYAISVDGTRIFKILLDGSYTTWASGLSPKTSYSMAADEEYLYIGGFSENPIVRIPIDNPAAGEEIVASIEELGGVAIKVLSKGEFIYASILGSESDLIGILKVNKQTKALEPFLPGVPVLGFTFDKKDNFYYTLFPFGGGFKLEELGLYKYDGTTNELILPIGDVTDLAFSVEIDQNDNWYFSMVTGGIRKYTPDFLSYEQVAGDPSHTPLFTMLLTPGGSIIYGNVASDGGDNGAAELYRFSTGATLEGIPAKSDIGEHPVMLEASNIAGSVNQEFVIKVVDKTSPVIVSFTPADEATDVSLSSTLTFTFDEEVVLGKSGIFKLGYPDPQTCAFIDILSLDLSDEADLARFSVSDDKLSISLILTENLPVNTKVLVEIPQGFAADLSGNDFKGFALESYTWSFTTANKNKQTITFGTIVEKTYGDATFTLGDAISDQGLTVTYTAEDPSVVSITGNQATILKAGSTKITATQVGDDLNFAAEPVEQTLTILKADLTINVDADQSKIYGLTDPTFSYKASGFKGDDDVTILSGALSRATGESVGDYEINQGKLNAGDNYTISFTGADFAITAKTLTITAEDKTKIYGQTDPEFTVIFDGFIDGEDENDLSGVLSLKREEGENAGIYTINADGFSSENYKINFTSGKLEINQAKLIITADDKQKTYGDTNPTLTFIYTGLVNGDTKLATEPGISTTATTSSNAGTYPITLNGGADQNYKIKLVEGMLIIGMKDLTITADDKQKTYGDSNPALTFSYAGLVNGDTKLATEPGISTTATASSNVGTYPITLNGGADQNYTIKLVEGMLIIGMKDLTITADDKQKTYGDANPTLTFTYAGLVNGDTKLTTEPGISTTATAASNVGTYPITLTGGADQNYSFKLENGTLTIGKKDLTVTADDKQKTYGDSNPALTFSYAGLVNGDTKLTTEPGISTPASASSNVGTYPIVLTGGADQNYAVTLVNGTLTIGQKALTITADDKQKTYGDSNPALTFSYAGLVNGDTKLTTEPGISTTATSSSNVGTYPIILTGGADQNYAVTLVNGTLIIGQKALTITADDKQKTYGDSNPALTFSYAGLVNGDTKLTTEPGISTTATASSNAGTYPITLNGGADQNYAIKLVNGTLTIGKKDLVITADDKQKTYGDSNPALTFSYAGLVNGDVKLTTEPGISTTATAASNVGAYPITLTGGADQNYAVTLVNGTLTINKATLRIEADAQTKVFGAADPELTFIVTGYKGTDTEMLLTGIPVREAGEAVGMYTIEIGTLNAGSNYQIEYLSAQFEIVPAELISLTDPDLIQTPWSVSPALPAKLFAVTADGQVVELSVIWDQSSLNLFKRGKYFLTGTVTLSAGILNPEGLTAILEVVVLAKGAPQDLLLSNSAFEPDPNDYFQEIGNFQVIDPLDQFHFITLVPGAADNQYFEVIDGILFWSSAEKVAGITEFQILVKVEDRDGNVIERTFTILRGRIDIIELEVFNTFTPDGDGFNDTWGVQDMRYFQGVRVQVFDRNGERLFYTEDADKRWDSTYQGKEMPVGTYFWVIEVIETGQVRRGTLTLLRK